MAQHISAIIWSTLRESLNRRKDYEMLQEDGILSSYCQVEDNCVVRVEKHYGDGYLRQRKEYDQRGRLRLQEGYNFCELREGMRTSFTETGAIKSKTLFVRGSAVDDWLHKVINERPISAQDIIRIDDDEIRRVCIKEMGYEQFLSQVEYKVIAGECQSVLIRVNLPGKQRQFSFLWTYAFEVKEWYLLRAPLDAKTIQGAFAWALERIEGASTCWLFNWDR